MSKVHVRRGDTVKVITGKDKGKTGKVMEVLPDKGTVLVDGVNVVKRHTRPKPPKVPQGGIMEKALPVQGSKVMLVCKNPRCGKPTRIAHKVFEDGHKGRVCKHCQEEI
jgi:large subunit ribosomal protein L24